MKIEKKKESLRWSKWSDLAKLKRSKLDIRLALFDHFLSVLRTQKRSIFDDGKMKSTAKENLRIITSINPIYLHYESKCLLSKHWMNEWMKENAVAYASLAGVFFFWVSGRERGHLSFFLLPALRELRFIRDFHLKFYLSTSSLREAEQEEGRAREIERVYENAWRLSEISQLHYVLSWLLWLWF